MQLKYTSLTPNSQPPPPPVSFCENSIQALPAPLEPSRSSPGGDSGEFLNPDPLSSWNYVSGEFSTRSFQEREDSDISRLPRGSGLGRGRSFGFLGPVPTLEDSERSRALLKSGLKSHFPGINWDPGYHSWNRLYQKSLVNLLRIPETISRCDGEAPRTPRSNFYNCHTEKTRGKIYPGDDGTFYHSRIHCGQPGCIACDQSSRGRLAREWLSIEKAVVKNYPEGFRGFLSLVFTLPKCVEGLPLKDKKLQQKILDGIHQLVKEIFGAETPRDIAALRYRVQEIRCQIEKIKGQLRTLKKFPGYFPGSLRRLKRKTLCRLKSKDLRCSKKALSVGLASQRQNIAMKIAVHPIGTQDILRDRCHYQVSVIPAVIERRKFRWIYPVRVIKEHTPENWLLDLPWLRERVSALFSEIFGQPLKVNQPQVSFLPSPTNIPYWQRHLRRDEKAVDVFWRRAGHQSKYDLRAFSRDLENVVLRTDSKNERFLIKAREAGYEWWDIVPASFLVNRYLWIRKQNRISTRGWAQCLEHKYADIVPIPEADPGPPPEVGDPIPAEVAMIREKKFTGKKVVWVRDEVFRFLDPVAEKERALSVNAMKPWVWDDRPFADPDLVPDSVFNPDPDPDPSPQGNLPGISRAPPEWWRERGYVQ